MEIITQKDAKEKGLIFYFTGKPCKHGHITYRMVSGGGCRECKNLKSKQDYIANPEKSKKYHREYHKKNYTTEKRRIKYFKNIEGELLSHAKGRAIKNDMEFNLKITDIVIPEYCPVLNLKMFETPDTYPSLDRLDNSKGYTKENVFVISKRANRLKSDASLEELKSIIRYIEKNITH